MRRTLFLTFTALVCCSLVGCDQPSRPGCEYGLQSLRKEYSDSTYVIVGTVLETPSPAGSLKVVRVYKGSPPPTLPLARGAVAGSFPVRPGPAYLLFIKAPPGAPLTIDGCGQSKALTGPRDPILGKLEPPPGSGAFDFIRNEEGEISVPAMLGIGVALATIFGFWRTLTSGIREQRWKRKEYVLRAFQERYDSPGAKNASFLLYWEDRHIPLWGDDEPNRWTRVSDEEAACAILPYRIHPFDFTGLSWLQAKRRIALNDSFVDLIWRLDHVRVVSKAASLEEVREIIRELGEILEGGADASRVAPPGRLVTSAFKLMLASRGMDELVSFFDDHGYNVRYTSADHERLKTKYPWAHWAKLDLKPQPRQRPPLRYGPAGWFQRKWRELESGREHVRRPAPEERPAPAT